MGKGKLKQSKGITLISLVITIIVLLILAAVSIGMLLGENGILTRANEAAEATSYGTAEEKVKLAVLGSYDNTGKMSDKLIVEELYKYENQGMTSLTDKDGTDIAKGTLDLIDKYPIKTVVDGYEFEIEKTGKVTGDETSTGNTGNNGNTGGTTNPPEEETLVDDGTWDEDVNSPKLGDEMTPVAWDDSNNEFTPTTNEQWYDYKDTEVTGADTSKWANAKTSDGSYWVWIPRYEYKLNESAQTIDINFIPVSQTTPTSGYKIHTAFEDGSDTNFMNGEWDKELAGIWVMKYEASNSSNVPKSVPGVRSWTNITIGDMYTYLLSFDSTKGSHLMKNSEWGAVAYLAHSEYGRNGVEVTVNSSSSFYTGGGLSEAYKTNVNQSTTGNVTGIYDLSGNGYEYVAGYIPNGHSYLLTYGSPMITSIPDGANANGYLSYSTKYVTAYPYNSSSDSETNNYNQYAVLVNSSYGYGDAILETSTAGSGSTSWHGDYSSFPSSAYPFSIRGGHYGNGSGAGLFCFGRTGGDGGSGGSFRAVLGF